MKKYIPYILSVCLTMLFFISCGHAAFCQSDADQKTALSTSSGEENPTYVSGITSARARSLVGGVLGLVSLIVGWRAKTRSAAKAKTARRWYTAALIMGLVATILSILHLAGNTGNFGTGGGKAGAIVALALGIIGTTVSGMALRRRAK